jgi:hypothetical protein
MHSKSFLCTEETFEGTSSVTCGNKTSEVTEVISTPDQTTWTAANSHGPLSTMDGLSTGGKNIAENNE